MATGTATLDFTSSGSQLAQVNVTGQAGILSGSNIEAFLQANDSTADNTAFAHQVVPLRVRCGNVVAGTGFTIYGVSDWSLFKTYLVRWVWV